MRMNVTNYILEIYEEAKKGKRLNCTPYKGETYNMILNASDEIYERIQKIKDKELNWGEGEEYNRYKIILAYLVRRQVMVEEALWGKYRRFLSKSEGKMFIQLPISIGKKAQEAGIQLYEINGLKKPFVEFADFFILGGAE